MRKIKLNKDIEVNEEVVKYVLEQHATERARIDTLKKYYDNDNDINRRDYKGGETKPKNKLPHPYASYITNMATGYFLGKPISYKGIEKYEQIQASFVYNDEADNNTTLAKNASICGYAVEILYADEEANVRFKSTEIGECVVVYDNTIEENILLAVRYYDEKVMGKDEVITHVEVYTKTEKLNYTKDGDNVVLVDSESHSFLDVPIVVYKNNDEMFGDFEKVKPLIDAYDKTRSDSANDFEMFTHAMLVISGYLINEDDEASINDKYTINFQDSAGDAKYLIKNIQDTALENHNNRIDNDIHKFSFTPNLSDENFANSSSGISLTYKLMGLENITGIKEAKFKKGLMRRIELMCNFLKIKVGEEMAYTDIQPMFTRNKPTNDTEEADTIQKLSGLLSEETLLSICSKVDNVQAEIERKKAEQKESLGEDYSNLDNTQDVKNKEVKEV